MDTKHLGSLTDAQCAFVGNDCRCPASAWLEFHHVVPYADGGITNASKLQLRSRARNHYEAELTFGRLGCVSRRALFDRQLGPARTQLSLEDLTTISRK